MNALPYYKRYPRDLIEGTAGMPFEEKAAYAFVLDLIYLHSAYLPDDPRFIAGHLGVSVRKWNAIRGSLIARGKLKVSGEDIFAPILSEWRRHRRPSLPASTRRAVFNRDGYNCTYCGDVEGPFDLDHVIPYSKGGSHDEDNLVVACSSCNRSKGAMTLSEWIGGAQ